jgi:hypothetical protein
MIRDARVLRAGCVPREVEHPDAEVTHLSSVLDPLTDDDPADTAIVTGPSGTGKTCISQFVMGGDPRRGRRDRPQRLHTAVHVGPRNPDTDIDYTRLRRRYERHPESSGQSWSPDAPASGATTARSSPSTPSISSGFDRLLARRSN